MLHMLFGSFIRIFKSMRRVPLPDGTATHKAWLLFISLALGGCTTFHPTEPHSTFQAIPAISAVGVEKSTLAAKSVSATPEDPSSLETPLTLNYCIQTALRNNPTLSATVWDTETARLQKRIRAAERWPNIQLNADYFHHQDDQRTHPPHEQGELSYYTTDVASAMLTLHLPLYAGGRIVNEIRAAELLAKSAEHSLARTRDEIIFNVTSTYYSIAAQRYVLESLTVSREALLEHLDRVHNLVAAQKAAKVDVLRTEVRLADIEQQRLQQRNVYDIERRFLANLMGIEERELEALDTKEEVFAKIEAGENIDEVIARAYDQRDDYAAAIAELEAQAKQVDIARGRREPSVTLEASYGGHWGIGGGTAPTKTTSGSINMDADGNSTWTTTGPTSDGGHVWSTTGGPAGNLSRRLTQTQYARADPYEDLGQVGVTVEMPIFEGGRIRAEIAKERAKLRASQERLRKLELQIRLEAETAVLNANSAGERVRVTQKSLVEAEESLRIERQKYEFAKGAIVDVLDAQSALLNAQTNYYRALADYSTAKAEIGLATGEMQ